VKPLLTSNTMGEFVYNTLNTINNDRKLEKFDKWLTKGTGSKYRLSYSIDGVEKFIGDIVRIFDDRLTDPFKAISRSDGRKEFNTEPLIVYGTDQTIQYWYIAKGWSYITKTADREITVFRDIINSLYKDTYQVIIVEKPGGKHGRTFDYGELYKLDAEDSVLQIDTSSSNGDKGQNDILQITNLHTEQVINDNDPDLHAIPLLERLWEFFDKPYKNHKSSFKPFYHDYIDCQNEDRLKQAKIYFNNHLASFLSERGRGLIEEQINHCELQLGQGLNIENSTAWNIINKAFPSKSFGFIEELYRTLYPNDKKISFYGFNLMKERHRLDLNQIEQCFRVIFGNFKRHGDNGVMVCSRYDNKLLFILDDKSGIFDLDGFTISNAATTYQDFNCGEIIIQGYGCRWSSRHPQEVKGTSRGYQIIVTIDLPREEKKQ